MTSKQPNMVFFSRENLGWGKVGCYGGGCWAARRRHGSTGWRLMG